MSQVSDEAWTCKINSTDNVHSLTNHIHGYAIVSPHHCQIVQKHCALPAYLSQFHYLFTRSVNTLQRDDDFAAAYGGYKTTLDVPSLRPTLTSRFLSNDLFGSYSTRIRGDHPVLEILRYNPQAMPNLSPGRLNLTSSNFDFFDITAKLARFIIAAFLIAHICWAAFSLIAILRTMGTVQFLILPLTSKAAPDAVGKVAVLARDSIVYFIGAFCILLVDLFYWEYGKAWTPPALITPGAVFACVGLWLGDSLGTISRTMVFARFAGNRMTVVRTGEEMMSGEVIPDGTPHADP
ncbi:hypothetical protein K443DRAFT_131764 [Laccaria amethystina LaAM-08-1]|uniref:Uncharacterized protein n=1 Tax=Laccaria amethystina LaAM-08-1 TaxID=1095629 RepID=A0A0C9XYC0_9AGAR|nr:hypothetical protein K443DRAFT_131764 [Laccaria amethystina LaAM-08-1]